MRSIAARSVPYAVRNVEESELGLALPPHPLKQPLADPAPEGGRPSIVEQNEPIGLLVVGWALTLVFAAALVLYVSAT